MDQLLSILESLRFGMGHGSGEAEPSASDTARLIEELQGLQRDLPVHIWVDGERGVRCVTFKQGAEGYGLAGFAVGMGETEARSALPGLRPDDLADEFSRQSRERLGLGVFVSDLPDEAGMLELYFKAGRLWQLCLYAPWHRTLMNETRARAAERRLIEEKQQRWRAIAEPDAQLREWARYCQPWSDSDASAFMRFAEWLITRSDPDEWHCVVEQWNWDYGYAPLLWIARHKQCDRGTALKLYYSANPEEYWQANRDRASIRGSTDNFDLVDIVVRRVEAGRFSRAELAYDTDFKSIAAVRVREAAPEGFHASQPGRRGRLPPAGMIPQ